MRRNREVGTACAMVLALGLASGQARAQDELGEHMRSHALRYASMIERAYGRLHGYIRNRATAATSWTGAAIPPAATGWESVWTDAGVRARYCGNVLLVYIAPDALKGVGDQHRTIQEARRNFLAERETGVRLPMLSWLESGAVTDSQGNVGAVPACMVSSYTAPLPSGRAALSGDVVDPWTDIRERTTFEARESGCPAGHHGMVRERRSVTQDFNAKGDASGPQVFGVWTPAPGSWCRADYTYNEVYTQECAWTQGPPFNRKMTGTETYRIPVSVTADRDAEAEDPPRFGVVKRTSAPAVFVSTTCWGGPPPTPPVPTTSVATETQTRTLGCGSEYTGSIGERRTKTTATTTFPWNEAPLVSVEYSNWSETNNTCRLIPPPPQPPPPEDEPPEDEPPKDEPPKDVEEDDTNDGDPPCETCGEGGDGTDNDGSSEVSSSDNGRDQGSSMDKDAITGQVDDDDENPGAPDPDKNPSDDGRGEGGDGGGGYGNDGGGDSGGSPHR